MILVSGFKKFGKFSINCSEILVSKLPNQIKGVKIEKIILPVSWKKSIIAYSDKIGKFIELPKAVILLGIHSGKKIYIERYAWNFKFGIDNDKSFKFGFIDFGNKLRIKSKFDLSKLNKLNARFKNIKFSNYPGSYLCNYIYYNVLRISNKRYPVVFIHLPNRNGTTRIYDIILEVIIKIINM